MYASSASSSVVEMGSSGRRINRWFNLNLEDIDSVREEVKPWRHAAANLHPHAPRPPPMIIEVCLDVSSVSASDSLHVADIHGRPWTVDLERDAHGDASPYVGADGERQRRQRRRRRRATSIVLEVWRLDLDTAAIITPPPDLPRVYKQAIVFFRSLYAFASLLPCVALAHQIAADAGGLALFCQLRPEASPQEGAIDLDVGLTNTERFLESHSFEPVVTPMGTFTMGVQYRRECLFTSTSPQALALQDSIAGLDLMDETYFTPTLSSRSGSNFSLQPQRHGAQPQIASSPRSGLPAVPQREAASLGTDNNSNNNLRVPQRIHRAIPLEPLHQQRHAQQRSSLAGDWCLAMPSVNPFRARPLSLGDSASLPNYI
ncbi:autophagy protein 13, partial [Coemansia biformis]